MRKQAAKANEEHDVADTSLGQAALANRQHVNVTVSDSLAPRGKWAAVDEETDEILVYADSVKQARDQGRALERGEPLIRWISDEPELPSLGL